MKPENKDDLKLSDLTDKIDESTNRQLAIVTLIQTAVGESHRQDLSDEERNAIWHACALLKDLIEGREMPSGSQGGSEDVDKGLWP